MAALTLTLLGPPQIARADGTAVVRARKELALLAYLAVESRHPHSRDTLLGMFWPEAPEEAARNSLRVALSGLRKSLETADERAAGILQADRMAIGMQVDVLTSLEGAAQRVALEQLPGLDRPVHAHEILEEDAARADRQVPHLRVPHLARRQADGLARRGELRVRIFAPQPVEDGRLGELDRVARVGWRDPPAVEDDERYEGIRAAVSHIALNDSTSSDAPPTSAPSTSGCASSVPALSGLTEPP